MKVNWDTYAEDFPHRYLEVSLFDWTVAQHLASLGWCWEEAPPFVQSPEAAKAGPQPIRVLEIGGGTTGCPSLLDLKKKPPVWFLDPFVTRVPEWVVENLTWETVRDHDRFEFVIARGCINYLTPEQLALIPTLVAPEGRFLANTFERAKKEGSRLVKNARGEVFQESFRMEPPNVYHHKLTPLGGGEPIEHTFFYYSREDYRLLLDGCSFRSYNTNSLMISIP